MKIILREVCLACCNVLCLGLTYPRHYLQNFYNGFNKTKRKRIYLWRTQKSERERERACVRACEERFNSTSINYFQKLRVPSHKHKTLKILQNFRFPERCLWGIDIFGGMSLCIVPNIFKDSSAKGQAAHGVKLPQKFYFVPKYKFSVTLSLRQDYNQ